jgi:ABC-2 type transport system permease protein
MIAPAQARHLAWRSVVRTLRHPHMIMPTLVFPLFMLAVNASGLQQATQIPGFPTDSYLTFTLGFAFLQGAIFAMLTAGTNLAEDIGTGFFTRLSLTPMRGSALLAGQLASVLLLSFIQAVTYLTVGLLAGADFESGLGGIPMLFALSFAIACAFGAIGLFVGLRSASGETVQALFPMMFVLLFLSSAAMPRDLIEQDWFQFVATINPVSYFVEGVRSLFITGWDAQALGIAYGIAAAIFCAAIAASSGAVKTRMLRT